jgi:[ribosomal protein S5]-alanine N-acetyltransferase
MCRDRLRLHRVEANAQPVNDASIRLIKSLGFTREGYSRRYLKIGGRSRDHERWARSQKTGGTVESRTRR